MRYLVLYLFFFSCNSVKEQEGNTSKQKTETIRFVDYKDFESALKSSQDLKRLSKDFDFFSILLLDSTNSEALFKFDPDLRENLYYASLSSQLSKSTVGFVTDSTRLRDVFLSKKLRNRIISCVYGGEYINLEKFEIGNPIYIKDNTAVVKIITADFSSVHYIRLLDNVVQINLLEQIIEN